MLFSLSRQSQTGLNRAEPFWPQWRRVRSAAKPQPKAAEINRGIREIRGKQTSSQFAFRVFGVFRGLSTSRRFVAACEQLRLLQYR